MARFHSTMDFPLARCPYSPTGVGSHKSKGLSHYLSRSSFSFQPPRLRRRYDILSSLPAPSPHLRKLGTLSPRAWGGKVPVEFSYCLFRGFATAFALPATANCHCYYFALTSGPCILIFQFQFFIFYFSFPWALGKKMGRLGGKKSSPKKPQYPNTPPF